MLLGSTLWKEGEGNRSGQRKKLDSDADPVKTSGDPQGAIELGGPSELLPIEVRELGLQTPALSIVYRLVLFQLRYSSKIADS